MLQSRSYHSTVIISILLASIVFLFMATFITMDFFHLLSALIIPLIFLIISGVFLRESVYFLIAPLILYFSDRVYIFLMNGLYALDLIANDPTIGFAGFAFYVLNLVRTMLAIGIATYAVYAISAKSDKSWRLLHRWFGILLAIHVVEYLFGISYFPSTFLEFLFAPGTLYFPVIMFTLTHPKWYVLDFEQSFTDQGLLFQSPIPPRPAPAEHPYPSQGGHASWQPSSPSSSQSGAYVTPKTGATVVCPHCQTQNRATDNFCKKCGQSIKDRTMAPPQNPQKASPVRPESSYHTQPTIMHICPECQSENVQKSPYCLSCGHNLKK